ncbi:hypothetical protein EDC04DRAFT_2604355 [Pisolithus marmoratus]|nr:hypothetical protein EDC04DRAFT_2604355 [Pisolithus marmoratus]
MWQKNKLLVEKVILQVQLEYKVFQKYENMWPVHDLLAQYLHNSSQKEKKAAMKFQHKSESNHSNLSGSVDGDASNVESSCSEMDSVNEESDASFRRCSNNRQADSEGKSDDDPRPLKSRPAQTLGHSSGSQRHWVAHQANTTLAPRSKPGTNQMIDKWTQRAKVMMIPGHQRVGLQRHWVTHQANVTLTPRSKPGMNQMIDKRTQRVRVMMIPSHQRVGLQRHWVTHQANVTLVLRKQLKTALAMHVGLVKAKKPNIQLATEICILIKQEQCQLEAIKVANEMNWPAMRINFGEIPNHILKLYDKLQNIILNKEACNDLYLWNCFKADLEFDGYTITQFARMHNILMSGLVWQNSHIGYYGSKGTTVIMHTLLQLFPPTTSTDAFQPLSLLQYFSYFVVPHIACWLIAKDFSISMTMSAYKLMVESSDYSDMSDVSGKSKHVVLHPPKEMTASSLGHCETELPQAIGHTLVTTTASQAQPQMPVKKPHGRQNEKVPVQAEAVEQDPGVHPNRHILKVVYPDMVQTQGQHT